MKRRDWPKIASPFQFSTFQILDPTVPISIVFLCHDAMRFKMGKKRINYFTCGSYASSPTTIPPSSVLTAIAGKKDCGREGS